MKIICHFLVMLALVLCSCRKPDGPLTPEQARLLELSNSTPKELHEALFAPLHTNSTPAETRAWQERSRKAIEDYERRQNSGVNERK